MRRVTENSSEGHKVAWKRKNAKGIKRGANKQQVLQENVKKANTTAH